MTTSNNLIVYNNQYKELTRVNNIKTLDQLNGTLAAIHAIYANAITLPDRTSLDNITLYENIHLSKTIEYKTSSTDVYWWISDAKYANYNLYKINSYAFIEAFISIFNNIDRNNVSYLDFRDFTLGGPFSYDIDGKIINYDIPGYDIEPYGKPLRIGAPIMPYVTFEDGFARIDTNFNTYV